MSVPAPDEPDALRPDATAALDAWSARVRAERAQVDRCREVSDPADFYAPVADRFRHDPRRTDDPVLDQLLAIARSGETWLDIGAGGGRYALPIALVAREVIAVDPSVGMLDVLRAGMGEHHIGNVRPVQGRWPLPGYRAAADVALMAHVGYDIEEIGPFLDEMEAAATRTCVAVMGEGAMTTVATLFWEPVHGERRIPLPALPEFVALLVARGKLFELRLEDRQPPTFDSVDDLLRMARRQLWVRPGSDKDAALDELVRETASEQGGQWALDWSRSRIGIVTWEPAGNR
jgi:SAM-dependent methyltransferase